MRTHSCTITVAVGADLGHAQLSVVEFRDHQFHVATRLEVLRGHLLDVVEPLIDARFEIAHLAIVLARFSRLEVSTAATSSRSSLWTTASRTKSATGLAVEFAGTHDECRSFRDLARQLPTVETVLASTRDRTRPRASAHPRRSRPSALDIIVKPATVSFALDLDVLVVAVGHGDGRLHGCRHHVARVLSDQFEKADQLLVARVETGAHARQVRPLGDSSGPRARPHCRVPGSTAAIRPT